MAKARGAATPALAVLDKARVRYEVLEHAHDPRSTAFGPEAVEKLGLPSEAVFKTLLVDAGGSTVTAVVPVGSQLDLKALASAVGAKGAQLLDPSVAQRVTGYVVGGISPLGQRKCHPCVVDDSALGLSTVYVSGGRRGLSVGLAPADLIVAMAALVAPITRSRTQRD
ncbi:MAG: Cys-tRNA(Pro) deacylase [Tessaracoccus sp.]|uniref:Cys-tRNA(Pro) deacylase n=1 Tax=Tessaracoccus sp. TaxID=1971211 RepID=UPI001EB68803|nr:Cys-tRNA(Pro) deacylase [Tessaracoccus sp.]MBK7820362.1 Cys-tRNA(Pro) deacylase [Tessaracoccus sp.]